VIQRSRAIRLVSSFETPLLTPSATSRAHTVFPDRWGKSPTTRVLIVKSDPVAPLLKGAVIRVLRLRARF
jgi:hypothetical protein